MTIDHALAERAQIGGHGRLAQGYRASFTLCAMKLHARLVRSSSSCSSAVALLAVAMGVAIGVAGRAAFAADDDTHGIAWQDAIAPDRYFSIRFPGRYQTFSDPAETEDGHKGQTIGVRGTVPGAFGGSSTFVASCIVAPDDDREAQARIGAVLEHWKSRTVLAYQKPIELDGSPGVEFQFADDVKVLRSRVYATPDRTCTVLVFWKPYSKPREADLVTFFDSFQFLPR